MDREHILLIEDLLTEYLTVSWKCSQSTGRCYFLASSFKTEPINRKR